MSLVFENQLIKQPAKSSAEVYLALFGDDQLERAFQVADFLRREGLKVEIALKAAKLGKQIELADKKGIPYVVLMDEGKSSFQLKRLSDGEQSEFADLSQLASQLQAK